MRSACALPPARLLSCRAACPRSSVSAFRSRRGPCQLLANADRVHQQKNRAAPVRALWVVAPCQGKFPTAAVCFSARESRGRRPSRSCTAQKSQRIRGAYLVLVHNGDMLPAGLLQQLVHTVFRKARVAGFDCQEKSVIGHAAETIPVEHGMVPARQAIHDLPRKEPRKCGEKHREFEHDRKKGWNGEKACGLTVDIERVQN